MELKNKELYKRILRKTNVNIEQEMIFIYVNFKMAATIPKRLRQNGNQIYI